MSYYDQAVMMQLKLGAWGADPSRKPIRRGERRQENRPNRTRFFMF